MSVYFQTPDGGFGETDSVENIPPGGTEITEAEYVTLQAAWEAERAAEFQAELEAAYQTYRTTFATYCGMGLPANVAATMAAQAGIMPPDFDPTTCPPAP